MTQWISIKDRLPEKSGEYLVLCQTAANMMVLNFSRKHLAFNVFDCQKDAKTEIKNITHWMPLPKPPEETT